MKLSSKKGICWLLTFALTASLLGIGGMHQIANALDGAGISTAADAANADDSVQPANAERVGISVGDVPLASDMGAQEALQEGATQRVLTSEANDDSVTLSQPFELPFEVPEERYVFEYVYGVLGDNRAIVSNEAPFDYLHEDGTLISKNQGVVLEEGVTVRPRDVTRGLRFTPFRQDGKWGIYDLETQRPSIEAKFDIVEASLADKPTPRYGFIQLGNQRADGVYPDAAAVICSDEQELVRIPLGDYAKNGRIDSFKIDEASYWNISWSRVDALGNEQYMNQRYSDSGDPAEIFLINQSSPSKSQSTFDGRTVNFYTLEGKVHFAAQGKDGTYNHPVALPTDATDIDSYGVVSNIIQVYKSNGHDYQYFTLDGVLLQSLDDKRFTELGNYVSYERTAFDAQKKVCVFLDTSDECKEAFEIPILVASFPNINHQNTPPIFECLTENNRIERYDENMKLVKSFVPTANLVRAYDEGRGINWDVEDFGDDIWLLSETVKTSSGWNASVVEHHTHLFKDSVLVGSDELGLRSDTISSWGSFEDSFYLMDNSGSYKLRVFDRSLELRKELDLTPLLVSGTDDLSVSIRMYSSWLKHNYPVLSVNTSSDHLSYLLDPGFNITNLTEYRELSASTYAAKKEGKWGFVDENLNPLTGFIYDDVMANNAGGATVKEGDKWRFLDSQLKDAFGGLFDSIIYWTSKYYLVQDDGNFFVCDSQFRQVDMQGYQPVGLDGAVRMYRTCRTLPDGRLMIYAWDSQGKLGAIDDAGGVVIPFVFEDFAECADIGNSENIMLRDEGGWFFISLADILESPPASDDCDTLGHDYEDAVYEPTCTTNGYVQHVCKRCGYGYRDDAAGVPMLGHDFVLTSPAAEPTCTEDGKGAEYACSRCQATKKDDSIPNLGGHTYSAWQVVDYPNCTEDGHAKRTCTRCGDVNRATVYAYGHSWADPTWEWTEDFGAAVARTSCERGCGEELSIDVEASHEEADSGMRHVAQTTIDGRRYQDGRLVLGWVDQNGIVRDLLVKGSPVADGFSVRPDAMDIPEEEDGPIEMDIIPVTEGGVFDALVSKIGSGWPAGTFDVRLSIGGEELHEGFGELTLAFPAGAESAGKAATVYHCHKDDRGNITEHELRVGEDGMVVLAGIIDLSTFLLEVQGANAPTQGGTAGATGPDGSAPTTTAGLTANNTGAGSSLAKTGDANSMMLLVVLAISSMVGLALASMIASRRRSRQG